MGSEPAGPGACVGTLKRSELVGSRTEARETGAMGVPFQKQNEFGINAQRTEKAQIKYSGWEAA